MCKNCVQRFDISRIKAKSRYPSSQDFEYLDAVIYGADYAKNPEIRAAIAQFKYKFTKELNGCFADLLSQKLKELNMLKAKSFFLVPVPLHKKRLNYRGFNQAELIALKVSEYFSSSRVLCFLVDDVCTTGATLDSCAKVLKEAGLKKVYGLVVARAFK